MVDPRVLLERDRSCSTAKGVDCSRLKVSRQRAPDPARTTRSSTRCTERYLGKNKLGTTQARHRPGLRRQGAARRPARAGPARPEDLPREARGRAAHEKNPILAKVYNQLPRRHRRRCAPSTSTCAGPGSSRYIADTVDAGARGARRGPARAARRRAGHVPRPRPRHLSVRHVVEPGRRRRVHGRGRRAAATSTASSASRRRTSRASAPARSPPSCSTTSATTSSTSGTSTARTPAVAVAPGWFDAVMMRHAVRLNSLSEVVDHQARRARRLDSVKVCVAYEYEGERLTAHAVPPVGAAQGRRRSTRSSRAGQTDLTAATEASHDLPAAARDYLAFLEEQVGVPINVVGVGPGREQYVHFARDLETRARA